MALLEPRAVTLRSDGGFTLIDMLLVIALVSLLSALAVPGLMRARGVAQSSTALAHLRTINSGQLSFAVSCGLGYYAPDLPTLGRAPAGSDAGFLEPALANATTVSRSGYQFEIGGTASAMAPASCNGLGAARAVSTYKVRADPFDPVNERHFATNSTGLLYEHTASLWAIIPELGPPPVGEIVK